MVYCLTTCTNNLKHLLFLCLLRKSYYIIYLRWFQLTPVMLNGYNDSDGAYVFGFILLVIYVVLVTLLQLVTRHRIIRWFLLVPTILLFCINVIHSWNYFPLLENRISCNGTKYYITWSHPFGDYQWTNYTLTKWKAIFNYETSFFGYTLSAGPFKIICDDKKQEANIVKTTTDVLVYTDGENSRNYDQYAGTQLKDHIFFLEDQCNDWVPSTCGSDT